jgi:hypothetical protein
VILKRRLLTLWLSRPLSHPLARLTNMSLGTDQLRSAQRDDGVGAGVQNLI